MSKLQELQLELAKYKSEAQTWEKAFKLMAHHGVPVNDEVLKKVRSKKTAVENFQEGESQAELFLKTNDISAMEAQLSGEAVGVQNAFLAAAAAWLREKVVETIIGFILKLIKENAVKVADWLLGQTEDRIVDGYKRLSDEDKFLFKNQLKETPRFAELLRKIEEQEQK